MNLPTEGAASARGDSAGDIIKAPRKMGELQKTITMAQIAKAAGVSQGAISSLLNDRDYGIRVSEKTRERVFKVCREMGYIPNDLRAVVRMYPEFGEFCLLFSSGISGGIAHPLCARIAAGALGAVPEPSHPVTFAFYDEGRDYTQDQESLPQPARTGIASKFLTYGIPNPTLIQALTRRSFPVLSLGHDVPLPGVLSLLPDYVQGARAAIELLSKLGHTNIGIISGTFGATDTQTLELNRGVRLACEEFGIPLEPHHIIYGELTDAAGRSALDELLARKPVPTAVFCMSDIAAAAVLSQAAARGLQVPRDLSVIGCGDDAGTQLLHPRLTTIHVPAEEMGAIGVREIDRLVREGLPASPHRTLLPVGLAMRDSTAAPRK